MAICHFCKPQTEYPLLGFRRSLREMMERRRTTIDLGGVHGVEELFVGVERGAWRAWKNRLETAAAEASSNLGFLPKN
ncbi:hypothetical protein V6Z11_A13G019800 [Gossypium hirsutum]